MNNQSLKKALALSPILFLLILPLGPLNAQEMRRLREKDLTVFFEEPLRVPAKEVASLYPLLKEKLEQTLRWHVNFRPTVVLVKENKTFQKMAGTDLVVAFAIPEKNLIVIDHSKMRTHPFSIETTLKHELCHLLLHSHIKRENLPKWLDEGVAQWVSDGIPEIIMNQKRSLLEEATLRGRYIAIGALRDRFPREKEPLMLAYEESKGLVEYMISSFGVERVLSVLDHLREGYGLEMALIRGLSVSLDELEARWHRHLKRRITWLTYLINHLYQILFFLAALIMIYGFIRRLMKKRAYSDEEEDDAMI
jgi:hypothetical protein